MRKNILFCAVAVLIAAISAATIDVSAYAADAPKTLTVTYVASPLNVPTIVERERGLFETAFPGAEIRLPEITAGPKQTEAMAAGEVDVAHCLGATSAILAASEGLDVRIVGMYSRAPKAFMIVTNNPGIKSAADLKGRKIGGPKGTILHQLLAAYTAKEGMKETDYEFINMGLPAAASALAGGSVDAALLAGPDAYRAVNDGAMVITDGVGLVDATTVIASTRKYMDKNPEVISRFLAMHKEALSYMKDNEASVKTLVAEATKLPAEAVDMMYPWYDFSPEIEQSDIDELERTQNFMIENGLQRNRIDIKSIIAGEQSE
ncbi:MAG: NrtA/SsuA/CpmA family ABC transporter substrate-binding protein [Synergistaceae bacterium]|jgi:sulfonate transport system substrate-binding protein|nr:NrtA/SsuA/CpmA family ABC transporter substrate-binding protein [Synergistaceae bacterium]